MGCIKSGARNGRSGKGFLTAFTGVVYGPVTQVGQHYSIIFFIWTWLKQPYFPVLTCALVSI